ncbi:P-loop containing nucleoside triphosphate hydrolase protein [Pestalotiopsis sp. NC0098]|nr:P-loop containing nucleoside triphosphate hydrolase protein [Pestalotiopsis sp. NC0098]
MASENFEVLIAVIGVTGAGKSTFINAATDKHNLKVGDDIFSCTQEIASESFVYNGRNVTLIDTPGFDDTYVSDADVLKTVATHLTDTYSEGRLLNGAIFLQPINGQKCTGNEMKRTKLFKLLLGEDAYSRVVIGTTMWDDLGDVARGTKQQEQRMKDESIWGDMINHGASVVKHENTRESALKIVDKILEFPSPIEIQLQTELRKNGGKLAETSAAREVDRCLGERVQKLMKELQDMTNERDQSMKEMCQIRNEIEALKRDQYSITKFCLAKWQKIGNKAGDICINFGKDLKREWPSLFG